MIIGLIIGGIIIPIAFVILCVVELHDKETRRAKGLPPKKYHDINDYDVTVVYTIEEKKR